MAFKRDVRTNKQANVTFETRFMPHFQIITKETNTLTMESLSDSEKNSYCSSIEVMDLSFFSFFQEIIIILNVTAKFCLCSSIYFKAIC